MQLGESGEGQSLKIGDVFTISLCEERKHIVAAIVPRTGWRMRIGRGNHLEFGERRICSEALVWINLEASRVIYRKQFHLVEIDSFFHRLKKAEAQIAIAHL